MFGSKYQVKASVMSLKQSYNVLFQNEVDIHASERRYNNFEICSFMQQ